MQETAVNKDVSFDRSHSSFSSYKPCWRSLGSSDVGSKPTMPHKRAIVTAGSQPHQQENCLQPAAEVPKSLAEVIGINFDIVTPPT